MNQNNNKSAAARHLMLSLLVAIGVAVASLAVLAQSEQQIGAGKQQAKLEDQTKIQRELGKSNSSPIQSGADLPPLSSLPSRPARHVHNSRVTIVDLSHPLHNGTLHWPKNSGFQYKTDIDSEKKSSSGSTYYIKSDSFTTAVHSGTHLDSPRHFSESGWTVDQIPLERLIDVPVSVIDLSEKVKANRSYNFVKEDFEYSGQVIFGQLIEEKSVVLIYTGISSQYDQGEKAYFGTDSKNLSEMKIPGFSKEAAQYLVSRKIYGVGLDAPSADSSDRHGTNDQYDPQAHVVFNSNNVYILENISSKLKELLHLSSVRLTIAPLPIVNGSGSPVRLIALAGHEECHNTVLNAAPGLLSYSSPACISIIIAAISYIVASRGLATW